MSVNTVFMLSCQGSQSYQMAKQLYDAHPVFRQWMDQLGELAFKLAGVRVVEAIYSGRKADLFDQTSLTHPAIFMVEYALAQVLLHEGIRPDLTLGASLGSFAAATLAGHLTPENALAAVLEQAASFDASCEPGGMIAIIADPVLFEENFLKLHSEMVGVNFATHFAVAAPNAALDKIEIELKQRNITFQRLAVAYAYHSHWVDMAQEQFAWFMQNLPRSKGSIPVVCCAQAKTLDTLPADFFWRVVRQQINFRDAIAHLEQQGPHRYIDLGPSGTLATFVKYGLAKESSSTSHALLTPYGQDQKCLAALLAACAT